MAGIPEIVFTLPPCHFVIRNWLNFNYTSWRKKVEVSFKQKANGLGVKRYTGTIVVKAREKISGE